MAGIPSYGAFRSIIDIYNFDSTTGEALGIGSPVRAHGNKTQILHRTQRKLSTVLQTYFYNLAPSPWSPPTTYLALHQSLEALEDVLHQLIRCEIDDRLEILGLVIHGLLDLMQELELLLMSSKVDGLRDEKWWDRFAKALLDVDSLNGKQYRKAQEDIDYYTWAGWMILRVSVNGDYIRRISATGNKLDRILAKLCEDQLALYIWDEMAGEESFDIKKKFSELAMYDGQCFIGKVTLEAALRVWMYWVNKATSQLKRFSLEKSVPASAYLDLLKAGWLFTLLREDSRSGQSSDELKAMISLISSELLFSLKLLGEQLTPAPDLDALVAEGEWAILLQSGFEDWELEGHEGSFIASHSYDNTDEIPNLAPEHSASIRDLTSTDDAYFEPSFRYSPIIMRDDDLDDDHLEGGEIIDLKTPLPLPTARDKERQDKFSQNSYKSSHSSASSLYSAYTDDTLSSVAITEELDISPETEPESPDIRSMMSPAAVPQSEYEMYEPFDSSYGEEDSPTKNDSHTPSAERDTGRKGNVGARNTVEENGLTASSRLDNLSPINSSPQNASGRKGNSPLGGSRFHEHLSDDFTSKLSHLVPIISIGMEGDPNPANTESSRRELHPPQSPLAPPPVAKDPSTMVNHKQRLLVENTPGDKRAVNSARKPLRLPVGGTMSSAGGRSSAAPINPPELRAGPSTQIKSTAKPGAQSLSTVASAASLAVPGIGMSAKEGPRTIPAPLQLSKKPANSLARALKTARADIHDKGGWSSLLTPGSGPREKNESSTGIASGGLLTSRRVPDYSNITSVAPLTVASGEVVAVNGEIRQPINKNNISPPTPAGKIVPRENSQPIESQVAVTEVAIQLKKSQKAARKKPKARVLKNAAARATVREKGHNYEKQPGEVEILPKELWEMNALVSDTGLPTGKWEECVVRIFKRDDRTFRLVTFRDGLVDEEFIDPSDLELVPEYAHHMNETVPIIFLRKVADKAVVEKESLDENGKGRRASIRSSFGCVGEGQTTTHIGAETFYYRFRRLDDMFNFQLAWLGEMVLTDIPYVKCIRFKKGLVGGESLTSRARLQIWREVPSFHEHGLFQGEKIQGKVANTRIVMYWDEIICTAFITEDIDIEAKPKTRTLRLKASARRHAFNNSIRARMFGQSVITTPATLVSGKISASTSGAINLNQGAKGDFSDEEQFDDFKWFEIDFHKEDEMKWFYQDFMRCQKNRIRETRVLAVTEKAHEHRK